MKSKNNSVLNLAVSAVCLALCLLAVVPTMISGKFRRPQGALLLAVYAAYIVLLVVSTAA